VRNKDELEKERTPPYHAAIPSEPAQNVFDAWLASFD
jgi:hypothetical protein